MTSSESRKGIGIIGAGGVARYAHLPAYKALGIPVAAVCDTRTAVLEAVARDFGVPRTYANAVDLIHDPAVEVLDIATPPIDRLPLLRAGAESHKPMLIQKPLCTSVAELEEILELRATGARVRMNMSGRHLSAAMKIRELIDAGRLGRPLFCTILNRDWWDRAPDTWPHRLDAFIVHEMTIHHLDLCMYWFGMPLAVAARGGVHPRQLLQQPNFVSAILDYESGLRVNIVDDWTMAEFAFEKGHPFEEFLLSGERGVIRASSERVEYSGFGSGCRESWLMPRPGQEIPCNRLERNWFPDSFGASMQAFLRSVDDAGQAAEDWIHLESLTRLAMATARALTSSRWESTGREVTARSGRN